MNIETYTNELANLWNIYKIGVEKVITESYSDLRETVPTIKDINLKVSYQSNDEGGSDTYVDYIEIMVEKTDDMVKFVEDNKIVDCDIADTTIDFRYDWEFEGRMLPFSDEESELIHNYWTFLSEHSNYIDEVVGEYSEYLLMSSLLGEN